MEIEDICNRIIDLYENPPESSIERSLTYQLAHRFRETITEDFNNKGLAFILDLTKKMAVIKGEFKQIVEEDLLGQMAYLPHNLWKEKERSSFDEDDQEMANSLRNFAKETYALKIKRDSFSGKRRGYAVRILKCVSHYFEVPEFMEMCTKSIKSTSKSEFIEAIENLREYCQKNELIHGDELIEIIDKRIEKTKHRSEAVVGLNFQVETGLIGELEALDILGEWKEKNETW